MEAAARRAERDSQRRYRQLQRDAKERDKMEARQTVAFEVELFENQVERLLSVHKEAPEIWDWSSVCNTPPPAAPERTSTQESIAAVALDAYSPGFLDKLLGRAEAKRQALAQALEVAKAQDEQEYQRAYQAYYSQHVEWDERRQLAQRILQGDTQAYVDALVDFNPFADISELGAFLEFKPHTAQLVEVRLTADGERLIPNHVKSLTSTGKLSTKPMAKGQFYEIYRDFVCGVALRAGRELFAFLPVQTVLVNVQANLLNTRTGNQGLETILSVLMARSVFAQLNFSRLDPSDAMENFPHRMEFKKTAGFGPVEPLTGAETSGDVEPGPTTRQNIEPPTVVSSALDPLLADHSAEDGCHRVPAGALASLVGVGQEAKLTIGICRRIAEAIEEAGYCIEPDARRGGGSYDWGQLIGIFQPAQDETIAPSPAYHGAANLLKLCVLVAAADSAVDTHELGVFRQVIESQLHFSQTELKRLAVLERLLAENPKGATKTLSKVAKAIPADKRLLVGQVVVKVAAVDHVITKSEFRALERIFKAFELPLQTLTDLMLQLCPAPEETSIQEAGAGAAGEAIPPREEPSSFSLDMSKVYAIANETKEVVGILSVVMEDDPVETPLLQSATMPIAVSTATEPVRGRPALPGAGFAGLDPAFHPVLERLLAKDSWPGSEFHALAVEFHLMPLSIHDVINEWADESLGDFLLEGEDPIVIHRELIRKETS